MHDVSKESNYKTNEHFNYLVGFFKKYRENRNNTVYSYECVEFFLRSVFECSLHVGEGRLGCNLAISLRSLNKSLLAVVVWVVISKRVQQTRNLSLSPFSIGIIRVRSGARNTGASEQAFFDSLERRNKILKAGVEYRSE